MEPTRIEFFDTEIPRHPKPIPLLDALEMIIGLLAIVILFGAIGVAVMCF